MKIPTRQPLHVHLNTCKKNTKYARQEKMANYHVVQSRPTYGTQRMATTISRITGKPVNRKKIKKIYHYLGWNTPAKPQKRDHTLKEAPKAHKV